MSPRHVPALLGCMLLLLGCGAPEDDRRPVDNMFWAVSVYRRDFGFWPRDEAEVLSKMNDVNRHYYLTLQSDGGLRLIVRTAPNKDGTASVTVTSMYHGTSRSYERLVSQASAKETLNGPDDPFR